MTKTMTMTSRSPSLVAVVAGAALAAAALQGGACVAEDAVPGPPYDVMVLDQVGAPTGGLRSGFAVQRRSLQTVTDFSRLESPSFRMRQAGTVTAEYDASRDRSR